MGIIATQKLSRHRSRRPVDFVGLFRGMMRFPVIREMFAATSANFEYSPIYKEIPTCYIDSMSDNVQYFISETHDRFDAVINGHKVGEITFVRVGADKLIIDYTGVVPDYRNRHIGLTLVRNVANMARAQHRHVITLCPFARAMFNRFSEFDDIRLMNAH